MVEFLYVRRREKTNRTNIYWVIRLDQITSILYEYIAIFCQGTWYTKTWYSSMIFMNL